MLGLDDLGRRTGKWEASSGFLEMGDSPDTWEQCSGRRLEERMIWQ